MPALLDHNGYLIPQYIDTRHSYFGTEFHARLNNATRELKMREIRGKPQEGYLLEFFAYQTVGLTLAYPMRVEFTI